jgi:hypothetical protein
MGEERSASAVSLSPVAGTPLTPTQFRALSEVPPEIERFVGIDSLQTSARIRTICANSHEPSVLPHAGLLFMLNAAVVFQWPLLLLSSLAITALHLQMQKMIRRWGAFVTRLPDA